MAEREQQQLNYCQLAWDMRNGTLYVHNKETGATVLRIQGLPVSRNADLATGGTMIDIHLDEKCTVSVPN